LPLDEATTLQKKENSLQSEEKVASREREVIYNILLLRKLNLNFSKIKFSIRKRPRSSLDASKTFGGGWRKL